MTKDNSLVTEDKFPDALVTPWVTFYDPVSLGLFIRGKISRGLAYVSRELSHLYGHSLSKEFVRGLRKP